jgi:uncharacterized iron-regulated membrane protein
MILVFGQEIEDFAIGGPSVANVVDIDALSRSLTRLTRDDDAFHPHSVYRRGGPLGGFDVYLEDAAERTDIIRLDAKGVALSRRPYDHDYGDASLLRVITAFHQELFRGKSGTFILGASGATLILTLIFGLRLGWPRPGQWRAILFPRHLRQPAAAMRAWHRALGLWGAGFALITIGAGVLQAYVDPILDLFPEEPKSIALPSPAAERPTVDAEGIATAIRTALARHPGATFSSLRLPEARTPWYRVRLLVPGDLYRLVGQTIVELDAGDGHVLAEQTLEMRSFGTRLTDSFYPIHTGEAGGLPGRIIAALIGLWAVLMIGLGCAQWYLRPKA